MLRKKSSIFLKDFRMRGLHQLVAGAVMISFSAVFVKLANVGPTSSALYRMLFGGLLLITITLVSRKKIWYGWKAFYLMVLCGAFFAVDLTLWHRSILFIGPGLATILANFQVFFLGGFGIIILCEKLTIRYALSVPIGLFGLYLIMGSDWSALSPDYKLGVLLGLLTALSYSCYLLTLRKLQSLDEDVSPFSAVAIISLSTSALLAVMMIFEGESFAIPDVESWASLIAYGVIGQVLGWVLISKGITRVAASRTGLVLLLQPSLAFIWDILFFSRPTGHMEILGCIIAIAAIYMGSTANNKKSERQRS
ncbi:DMT family transporter [Thermodesulfobacteriota bacterium]